MVGWGPSCPALKHLNLVPASILHSVTCRLLLKLISRMVSLSTALERPQSTISLPDIEPRPAKKCMTTRSSFSRLANTLFFTSLHVSGNLGTRNNEAPASFLRKPFSNLLFVPSMTLAGPQVCQSLSPARCTSQCAPRPVGIFRCQQDPTAGRQYHPQPRIPILGDLH